MDEDYGIKREGMPFWKKVALVGTALLTFWVAYEGISAIHRDAVKKEAEYLATLPNVIKDIEKNSPFKLPIEIPFPTSNTSAVSDSTPKQWYSEFFYVPVDSNGIVYQKDRSLYYSANKDLEGELVVENPKIKSEKHIYAVENTWKGAFDVYWFDWDNNLRKLENLNGKMVDRGVVINQSEIEKVVGRWLPSNISVGDINADGNVDIIYPGKVEVGPKEKNAIIVAKNAGSRLDDKRAIHYLGDESVEVMIAQDVDGDGDTDIAYKTMHNDSGFVALENTSKETDANADFKLTLEEKVQDESDDWFWSRYNPFNPLRKLDPTYYLDPAAQLIDDVIWGDDDDDWEF